MATKAKSAWEDFSSSNPYYLRSALNVNPVTGGLARLADAYTKYDNGDTQGALLGMIPGGGTVDKALKGDLAGAAKDVVFSQAPLVGKAYNYAMNDKQDPNTVPVEDRSTHSPEVQTERAAADNAAGEAAYYSNMAGGGRGYDSGSGDYGGGCPAPWINILLADGSTVQAGDVKPGMEIFTQHETTNEWGSYPVTAVSFGEDDRWEVVLEDDRKFVGTFNHRVRTDIDWVEIRNLQPGDKLVQPEGFGIVKSSKHLDNGPIVKITVAGAHTYISEGFLSHNVKYTDAYKRGGKVKAYAKGGAVSSKPVKSTRGRGDGIAQRGHTKGRIV